jgi:hypothetical protein
MVYNNDDIQTQFYGFFTQNYDRIYIYIVFRGTVPSMIDNWIANLNVAKTDYPNPQCI